MEILLNNSTNLKMINAISVGDAIKWIHEGIHYLAEVEHINNDGDYCVSITYDIHGYSQDYISPSHVVSVYQRSPL